MKLKRPTSGQLAAGLVVGAILVAAGLLLAASGEDHAPADSPGWLRFPLFYAFFGCAAAIALVVVAKVLGALFLQREEDIYE